MSDAPQSGQSEPDQPESNQAADAGPPIDSETGEDLSKKEDQPETAEA